MEVQSVEEARFVDAQYFYLIQEKKIWNLKIYLSYWAKIPGSKSFFVYVLSLVMYAFIILFYAQG